MCAVGRPTPANTKRSPISGLMLAQRRRRRANIKPTLGERLVFSGTCTFLYKHGDPHFFFNLKTS